ncbi:glutamate--cysteine ligase, partial [Pseudomonas syringae]
GLSLMRDNRPVDLKTWATELVEKITPIARLLDQAQGTDEHLKSIAVQQAKIDDTALTPSAQVLASMEAHNEGFTAFSLRQSQVHAEYFRTHPLSAQEQADFEAQAKTSIEEQAELEATEEVVDFDTFVGSYQASILSISN